MNNTRSIRFNFVENNSRSILLTDEPALIDTINQEIASLIYSVKHSSTSGSQPYIEKIGAGTYKVSYSGYMKIMAAIAYHMKS